MKKPKPRKPGKKKQRPPVVSFRERMRLEREQKRHRPTLGLSSGTVLAMAFAKMIADEQQ